MDIDLCPVLVVDPVCDLEKGVVGSDVGCLFGCLGASVSYLDCLGGSLEDLAVVKFLL